MMPMATAIVFVVIVAIVVAAVTTCCRGRKVKNVHDVIRAVIGKSSMVKKICVGRSIIPLLLLNAIAPARRIHR